MALSRGSAWIDGPLPRPAERVLGAARSDDGDCVLSALDAPSTGAAAITAGAISEGALGARSPATLFTTFVNPNHAAGFMVMTALSAAGLALVAKRRSRT
jgi:hypothetical protein